MLSLGRRVARTFIPSAAGVCAGSHLFSCYLFFSNFRVASSVWFSGRDLFGEGVLTYEDMMSRLVRLRYARYVLTCALFSPSFGGPSFGIYTSAPAGVWVV
jgi:hypothetical protein